MALLGYMGPASSVMSYSSTVPAGYNRLVKSMVLTNPNDSTAVVSVKMGTGLMNYYQLYPRQTLSIPNLNIVVEGSSSITLNSNAGVCFRLTVIEYGVLDSAYSDYMLMGKGLGITGSTTQVVTTQAFNRMIDTIVLCNMSTEDTRVFLSLRTATSGFEFLRYLLIPAGQSYMILDANILLMAAEDVTVSSTKPLDVNICGRRMPV